MARVSEIGRFPPVKRLSVRTVYRGLGRAQVEINILILPVRPVQHEKNSHSDN